MATLQSIKHCPSCKLDKPTSDFTKDVSARDGLNFRCKPCQNVAGRRSVLKHRAKIAERQKAYCLKFPEVRKATVAKCALKRRDKKAAYEKLRYARNRTEMLAKIKAYQRKPDVIESMRRYRKWYESIPNVKIARSIRIRIRQCLGSEKENGRNGRSLQLLGLQNRQQLIEHLQVQFRPGMTWDNYGRHGWTIDHIVPLSRFDLTDPRQAKIAFNYMNLQPLWYWENSSKGNRLPGNN